MTQALKSNHEQWVTHACVLYVSVHFPLFGLLFSLAFGVILSLHLFTHSSLVKKKGENKLLSSSLSSKGKVYFLTRRRKVEHLQNHVKGILTDLKGTGEQLWGEAEWQSERQRWRRPVGKREIFTEQPGSVWSRKLARQQRQLYSTDTMSKHHNGIHAENRPVHWASLAGLKQVNA